MKQFEDMGWINLARGRHKWHAVVNTVMTHMCLRIQLFLDVMSVWTA
jgi:hypothetical protein